MSGKKIEFYIDVVSLYSYFAFFYLQERKEVLASHGVEIEYIPVFLGGINHGSGNQPPWKLPAKGRYGKFDSNRASQYFGKNYKVASFFPLNSLLPQRCLIHIKSTYPSKFEAVYTSLFHALWEREVDLAKPDLLSSVLHEVCTDKEVEDILAAAKRDDVKGQLMQNTEHAWKDLGAFGAPWFWVTNGNGKCEPFFGSDRWGYIWEFLGLPYEPVKLLGKARL